MNNKITFNKLEHLYVHFIFIITIIKIIVIILIFIKDIILYTNLNFPILEKYIDNIQKLQENFEFILNILVSLLIMFLFNPFYPNNIKYINYETRLFLFIYGIYLVLVFIRNYIHPQIVLI